MKSELALSLVDEIIVEEGVSRFGLHRLHVIRMGGVVDQVKWIEERVGEGRLEALVEYEDEGLGIYHLRLYWKDGQAMPEEINDGRQ